MKVQGWVGASVLALGVALGLMSEVMWALASDATMARWRARTWAAELEQVTAVVLGL